ncbi:MAG: hypothetical protein HWD61_07030 [Parachlamydiaceae bacterium]|nr:MAG: hypothetical protein HWD61_07030 [Parachlamydiaceae bacterium]
MLSLASPEALLLSDNLIPKGSPINQPLEGDFTAQSIYEYNEILATDPRIDTILATTIVGENGRIDGLGISLLNPKI